MAEPYSGREQTQIKHTVLRTYLSVFARIVGKWSRSIAFVDCMAGPWNTKTENFSDSSFGIAVSELREADADLKRRRLDVKLRCAFVEKDPVAFQKLKAFGESVQEIEVLTLNADFVDKIDEITTWVQRDRSFAFVFLDPKGWKQLEIDPLRPLLRLQPGEVLITLMVSHIRRWITAEPGMEKIFREHYPALKTLSGYELDDQIALSYADLIQKAGSYDFVSSTVVLKSEADAPHFYLIYGTRHPKGLQLFKDVERSAIVRMEETRADIQRAKREELTGNLDLFTSEVLYRETYFVRMRERAALAAERSAMNAVRRRGSMNLEQLWAIAAKYPTVTHHQLLSWVDKWQSQGQIDIKGELPRDKGELPRDPMKFRLVTVSIFADRSKK